MPAQDIITLRPWCAATLSPLIPVSDPRVLFNGKPPLVGIRVLSEANYQHAVECVNLVHKWEAETQGE